MINKNNTKRRIKKLSDHAGLWSWAKPSDIDEIEKSIEKM